MSSHVSYSERNYCIDWLRSIAFFGVVVLHAAPFSNYSTEWRYLHLILDTLPRFAVPLFFMISGYFLALKAVNDSTNQHVKSYIIRIGKIYIQWTAIYFIINLLRMYEYSIIDHKNFVDSLKDYFHYVFSHRGLYATLFESIPNGVPHLWYMFALFIDVLILLFAKSKRILKPTLIVSIILYIIGFIIGSYSDVFLHKQMEIYLHRNAFFFGLFYLMIGYFSYSLYNKHQSVLMKYRLKYIYLFWFFSIIQIIERGIICYKFNNWGGNFYISTFFVTASLFLWALTNASYGRDSKLTKIGKYNSLGMYLIHFAVLFALWDTSGFISRRVGFDISARFLWKLLICFVTFVLCYLLDQGIITIKRLNKSQKQIAMTVLASINIIIIVTIFLLLFTRPINASIVHGNKIIYLLTIVEYLILAISNIFMIAKKLTKTATFLSVIYILIALCTFLLGVQITLKDFLISVDSIYASDRQDLYYFQIISTLLLFVTLWFKPSSKSEGLLLTKSL